MLRNRFRHNVPSFDFNELLGKTIACISQDPKVRKLIEKDRQRLRRKERQTGDFEKLMARRRAQRKKYDDKNFERFRERKQKVAKEWHLKNKAIHKLMEKEKS